MYIPRLNLLTDSAETVAFMTRFSFATLITAQNNLPTATHLPFLVSQPDDKIILTSHFARANEQWKDLESNKALVIFSEPHAYISPKHYDKDLNVPTWNYISVHAYGEGRIVTDPAKVRAILEKTIDHYETEYRQQWNTLPEDYKIKMANGIVAFDITITDLQGKKKLSQNKNEIEKQRIIHALSTSENTNEQLIAEYMKEPE